jgi:hypothetical protein
MSRRFVVVAEDRQAFLLATVLCDRVIAERSGWLRDHWADEEQRRSFRVWDKLDASSPDDWTRRSDVKRLWPKRAHTLGMKAEGALAYKATKLALDHPGEAAALFVVHDSDGDPETAGNMREGARRAMRTPDQLTVIAAVPHPEAEAWVAAGIVPETLHEQKRHEAERSRLGFDPIAAPHELSSGKSTDKRDAKGTCREILGGAFKDAPERWARCWEATALETLERNGRGAGLSEYVKEVEERVLPLLGDRSPRSE